MSVWAWVVVTGSRWIVGYLELLKQATATKPGQTPSGEPCGDLRQAADLESLSVVQARAATTAGDLAAATGLSTGAITGSIDRSGKAGCARREDDPTDRRRVLLRVRPAKAERAAALYSGLGADMLGLLSAYSDEQH